VGLAVADQFCKQEDKKKRVNEVDTWQVGGSKFLSPSDILGCFLLLEKGDGGGITCIANGVVT
jgi:hypothetical protein